MAQMTLTRADLAERLHEEIGLSRNETSELVEQVIEEIISTLAKEENVKISKFGSFNVRQKDQRIGRNPKTGEEVPILPRKVISFRASKDLKDTVLEGNKDKIG
mgnify:CR=1 FL=1